MPIEALVGGARGFPAHVFADPAVIPKLRGIAEGSKTTRQWIPLLADSNGSSGTFAAADWRYAAPAPDLARALAPLRANADGLTAETLAPQTVVIKPGTMGNAPVNSAPDTPWHPSGRRWWGGMLTALGPLGVPYPSIGGYAIFENPAATNRWFGWIVDRTASGADWERRIARVAIKYWARGNPGQTIPSVNGMALPNGAAYAGPAYTNGIFSPITVELLDVTGIDASGIPATGWDAAAPACAGIRSAVNALTPYATMTIDPAVGAGAPMPGFLSPWLGTLAPNVKTLVRLRVGDGATLMGTRVEALVLDTGEAGGVSILDESYSGNALGHCPWTGHDAAGALHPSVGGPLGDLGTDAYSRASLAARLLMWGEKTYAIPGHSNAATWANAPHNVLGLAGAVVALMINDVANSTVAPLFLYRKVSEMIAQAVRVNPNAVLFFVLPPCIGFSGGDNVRDNWYTGLGGVRAKWSAFVGEIRRAAAAFPANAIVIDYQAYYGDIAPTALKARLGHFGVYRRSAGDPIDGLHFKYATWLGPAMTDVSRLILNP